ncbi:MAG: hypothetical protein II126_06085, partial [Erysipelotrichaceae bacterium]|nr:hypothetical protein [Erysipelotrichaceae bacterium]
MMLSRLCERRMNIRDALEEMCRMYPRERRLSEMRLKLTEGAQIAEALGRDAFEKELGFYCRHLPFAVALQVTLKQHKRRKETSNGLLSAVGYQLVLGICALALVTLFSSVL